MVRRHLAEWWLLYALIAVFGALIGGIIYDNTSYTAACKDRGGLVWQRDGRACLLPPYNRVEM